MGTRETRQTEQIRIYVQNELERRYRYNDLPNTLGLQYSP